MAGRKVLLVVAHEGFQHVEYGEPKKLLEDAGFVVVTASDGQGPATGDDGSTIDVNLTLESVRPADYAGVFFIGGSGALEHLDNELSYKIVRDTVSAHIPLGAICVSTRVLAKAGVLKERHATGWDGDGELAGVYETHGVDYVRQDVVVDDGLFITAVGPSAAREFGKQLISLLQDSQGWG